MADADELKRAAALAALELVEPGIVLGVGTGSTVNHLIDALPQMGGTLRGAVASSLATEERLRRQGIPLVDLNDAGELPLYIDGADEATPRRELIKGGGAALTREKIVAQASLRFVCIVDESKLVERLGTFPLPIEVIGQAEALVTRTVERLGGRVRRREGVLTDNGNPILDVTGLDLERPREMEERLTLLPGVVTCGLFCRRPADLLLVARSGGVERV